MNKKLVSALVLVIFAAAVAASAYFASGRDAEETMARPGQEKEQEVALEGDNYLETIENNDACDEMMRQAYNTFQEQGPQGLLAFEARADVTQNIWTMLATGIDRYAYRISEDLYAMVYLDYTAGGYWWYFGRVENGIRSGDGVTVIMLPQGAYQTYTGGYLHDFPEGGGTLRFQNGLAWYELKGTFHGRRLNGVMEATLYNGITSNKKVKTTLDYEDGHLTTPCDIPLEEGKEMFVFAYLQDGSYMGWENTTQALDTGFEVFMGNENLLQK